MFPLHPQLLQIKCHGLQEQLRPDVGPPPGQKSAEAEVLFQQGKGPLHLDGAALPQMNAPWGRDPLGSLLPLLPERLPQGQLLGLVRILGPAAQSAAGTAGAVLAAIPGSGDRLASLELGAHSAQRKGRLLRRSLPSGTITLPWSGADI